MSRMFWCLIITLGLAALLLSVCQPEPTLQEYYGDAWIVGEHSALRLDSYQGIRGEFEGSFFLATGSVSGSFGTEPLLTFAWEKRPGERYITTLPISKFRFTIDEGKAIPTVEFQFKSRNFLADCHPSRGVLEEVNPNVYLMRGEVSCDLKCGCNRSFGGLKLVVVRISSASLEQEVYLPT